YKVFSEFGLKRFCISVNNRKILNGFYAMLGLTEKSGDIMRTVDKLDKIGPDKVRIILVEDIGLSEQDADEILRFIAIRGTNSEVIERLEAYRGRDEAFDTGLDELTTVTKYLAAFGGRGKLCRRPDHRRGLDYYTGTVYETRMLDHPEIGAICAGGRYDNLAEYYSDRSLPGVGVAIGLTRLFYVLDEQGMLNPDLLTAPADVLLLPMTDDFTAAVELATRFRSAGLRTQIYSEQKKFKAKMTYADKLGIPYVVFLGEDEIAQGTCSVKDLRTGQQVSLSPDEAVELIRKGISELNKGSVILEK
ncbi:MAG: His/Gly/Thr/Pro-type tRNA ligase C-terminal domain-containing protein, partial [Oscillospiraceae bacterium]